MPTPLATLKDALADRYRIERELGAGGMATVYLATDLKHDRQVAVKVLRGETGAVDVERFHREIRVVARLRHPFILPLHDSGEAAGALYFVMPYIDGESLRSRLERETRLPVADALVIARQVADALHSAHGEGVVHRDVKPENILIARSGHALLADFGIARGAVGPVRPATMTEVGVAIGTVSYMSPEQAMGEREIDARADVYALGCVVYEMLAGTPPFAGPTPLAVVAQHMGAAPPDLLTLRADLPPAVAAAVAQALAKAPADRHASAQAFARALETTDATSGTSRGDPQLAGVRAGVASRLSIAVLPIANIGADPENEYFSDGLTEELTSALSRLEGLRVVSRTSAFAFRGQALQIPAIAARLGVEFVLEGSVRRAGTRLRLTAKLIQVSEDAPLWAETFDRPLDDVFAVQDEVTARIVETITQALQLGRLRGQAPVATTSDLRAYDLYLLGRHHWYERTEAGMRRARSLFEEAIALDAGYAPAYSGLADASALLASWQFAEPADMYPGAVAAARRALELDETLAEAHASLGFVKYNWEWDWAGAERELRRAIALNPSHETAHRWLSGFLAGLGRDAEAVPIAQRVLELDPLSILPRMNLGIVHLLAGRHAAAEGEFRRVLEMQPDFLRGHSFLGATLSVQGRHEEALTLLGAAADRSGRHLIFVWGHGLALALAGRAAEAHAELEPLLCPPLPSLYIGIGRHVLGQDEAAFAALRQGVTERSDWMYSLRTQPWLRDLHADPRFQDIVASLRLPALDGASAPTAPVPS